MRLFFKNRILPVFCALSILVSVCVVPVSAVFDPAFADMGSVSEWESEINSPAASVVDVIAQYFGVEAVYTETFWGFVDRAVSRTGSLSQGEVESICASFNFIFDHPLGDTFFKQIFEGSAEIYSNSIALLFLGNMNLHFEIQQHPSSGLYRIKETSTDIWVVNSSGYYPYYELVGNDGETEAGDQWIGEITAQDCAENGTVALHTLDRINLMCVRLKEAGIPVQLRSINVNGRPKYSGIWYNRQFYADPNGNPYVAPYNSDEWASNQERPDTSVKDENGDVVEGLPENVISGIDLENMLITLPDGTLSILDSVIYDESTKSYYVDSHDTYNTTNNYYYHWEYHINYTSITYIGQTEEYNKYYEVYYELPDGRDSADLTKEEVEQLNLSVDVIPYGRSADDVSLRSLYHFDGDTMDSSYWNYCTDFTWNEGASLTYMDAAVFEGALYLDENVHDFTLTLPSEIGSDDFTLQFRYYQSYTAAPQTDSYIQIGLSKIFQLSGGYYSDSAGKTLATTPVGTWNEVAIMRDSGILYFYNNGVCIGSKSDSSFMNNQIRFYFGSAQQTYKYLDELRILNYALEAGGNSYTPTSVPHDTNLTLVLPDTTVPVADEYWKISFSDAAQLNLDFTNNNSSSLFQGNASSYTALQSGKDGIAMMFKGISSSDISEYQTYSTSSVFNPGPRLLKFGLDLSGLMPSRDHNDRKYYPVSVSAVMGDGNHYTLNFSVYHNGNPIHYDENGISVGTGSSHRVALTNGYLTADFNGSNEVFFVMDPRISGSVIRAVSVWVGDPVSSLSAVKFADTSIECEKISSITPMLPHQMKTPTLAVRTDLDITGYQIGGVRPSVPKNGMVWALVENERITSIQIYNGQAWEGVDGRIWTGSRWIPASSYNIVTLQDMFDIVDATQDYEYIYSESGFWDWWQKSWNAFTERLFSVLGAGVSGSDSPGADGGSGSDVLGDVDLDDEADRFNPSKEDNHSFWQFIVIVLAGGKSVVGGMRSLFSGFVSSVPASINTITGSFDDMGVVSSIMDGSYADPDMTTFGGSQLYGLGEVDPWRYR